MLPEIGQPQFLNEGSVAYLLISLVLEFRCALPDLARSGDGSLSCHCTRRIEMIWVGEDRAVCCEHGFIIAVVGVDHAVIDIGVPRSDWARRSNTQPLVWSARVRRAPARRTARKEVRALAGPLTAAPAALRLDMVRTAEMKGKQRVVWMRVQKAATGAGWQS